MGRNNILLLLICCCCFSLKAQHSLSWQQALDSAMRKNPDLIKARKYQAYQSSKVATAFDLPATQFMQEFTQGVAVNVPWQSTITQSGEWPGVYKTQRAIYSTESKQASWTLKDKEAYIQKTLLLTQMNYAATAHLLKELRHWDSLWATGVQYASLRAQLGETGILELKSIQQLRRQWQSQIVLCQADSLRYLNEWRQLCASYSDQPAIEMYVWKDDLPYPVEIGLEHPYLQQWSSTRLAAQQQVQLEKSKLFPSWTLGYQHYPASSTNIAFLGGKDAKAYVLMAGWSLPIFTSGQIARVKLAKQGVQYVQASVEAEQSRWLSNYRIAFADYIASKNNLNQYENSLLPDARQILQLSAQQYKQGNISYLEWLLLAQQNLQTLITYWQTLPVYNQRSLELHYLNTNK